MKVLESTFMLNASLFKKGLSENPWQRLSLKNLSPNHIGVITTLLKKGLIKKSQQRRGQRYQAAQRLRPNGCV
jgi:hypothetical protein